VTTLTLAGGAQGSAVLYVYEKQFGKKAPKMAAAGGESAVKAEVPWLWG
jgi:hypothetical protein